MNKNLRAITMLAGLLCVCACCFMAVSESYASVMKISVTSDTGTRVIYELNNSAAARSLWEQLPLELEVEDYSNNEKIFYPPERLDTSWSPVEACPTGTLAYFAPWGDVVMFYGPAPRYNGLYVLGHAIAGDEFVSDFTGEILVDRVE